MNNKERQLYELKDAVFTEESISKERRENAEFWKYLNILRAQSKDEIITVCSISKNSFMGKYCVNVEIQCASLDMKKAAEKILSTYYYQVPLQVNPSIGETSDLIARLPEH